MRSRFKRFIINKMNTLDCLKDTKTQARSLKLNYFLTTRKELGDQLSSYKSDYFDQLTDEQFQQTTGKLEIKQTRSQRHVVQFNDEADSIDEDYHQRMTIATNFDKGSFYMKPSAPQKSSNNIMSHLTDKTIASAVQLSEISRPNEDFCPTTMNKIDSSIFP